MDLLTDSQAGTVHITLHSILDQITEITTAIPAVTATDRATTETTIETEDTNKIQDMTKETRTTKIGMITTKIETDLTTGDDQTNINTTETNQKLKSYLNTQIRIY